VNAARRVARTDLGLSVDVGKLLGYIENRSHYNHGLDSPVGLAFAVRIADSAKPPDKREWSTVLPANMHEEQKACLREHVAAVLPGRTG